MSSSKQPMNESGAADRKPSGQPDGGSESVDLADLKRKSVRGGMITMVSQGIGITIRLTSTVVLARLLSPEDYGVVAMVLAVTGFAGLFRDMGLSSAAIQKKELTAAQQSNLFWLNVAMGALLTVIVAAGAPLVAWFYGKPELTAVTLTLSVSFLICSFGTQHGVLLARNMQFGRIAVTGIGGALVGLAVSIVFGLQGYSYWALVVGSLAGNLGTTLLLFMLSPFRPGWMSRDTGVRDMLKFGANVTAFDFANYLHRNLDNILLGRFWGPGPLGLYSRAYQLLMLPTAAIRGPINAVAFPAMSRLQAQPEDYRSYYRKIVQLIAFASMPLTALLFVVSAPLIDLLLGDEWAGVSPIFSLLAITSFIQPVAGLRGTVLLSSGLSGRYLKWGIINAACVSAGFFVGTLWGALGIAASYGIVSYAILYPSLSFVFKGTPLRPRDFFIPISVPAAASIVAASLTCYLECVGKFNAMNPLVELAILGAVFAAVYFLTIAFLPGGRQALAQIVRLLPLKQIPKVKPDR